MRTKSRVVTLAQLALLPRGTLVACVKFDDTYGQVQHDCQGIVQVGPIHALHSVDTDYVTLRPVVPEIRWHEGRVEESYEPTHIGRVNFCDHRFIVYPTLEAMLRNSTRTTWRP